MNIIIFFWSTKKKEKPKKKENKEEKRSAYDWAFSFFVFFFLQSKKNRASCLSQSRKYSHPPMREPATSSLSRKLTD